MLPKRSPSRWWLGSTKRFYAVRMGAANRERGSNYAGHRGGSTIQPQWQEGGLARGEFPAAPDVIYRNPEAVQNRLRLYHLLRLQNQVRLDAENLSRMGLEAIEKMKESSETENKIVQKFTKTTEKTTKIVNDEENFSNGTEGGKERYIKLTTFYSTGEAGCPRQLDPERSGSVKLEVSLDDIDVCNKTLLKVILAAAGRPVDSNQKIKYTVNDFPFQRQNRNRAFEILRDMLDHVAGPDAPILNENEIKNLISKCDLDQDSILNLDHSILNDNSISKIGTKIHKIVGDKNEAGTSSNLKVLARREKISTDFPQDWLPTKKK